MDSKDFSETKLGILGGGQLGKMLCLAASNWNLETYVLDPSNDCPAKTVCTHFIQGDFRDCDDVYSFGNQVDLLTIEIEHIEITSLEKLEEQGVEIRPSSSILKIIQDKGLQKKFYDDKGLPTAKFSLFSERDKILDSLDKKEIAFPFVQKVCKDGYDGRGVQIVNNENDLCNLFDVNSVIEELVSIKKELSVIVARNINGEIKCFSPVEMIINSHANLVDYLLSPATISDDLSVQAQELAIETIKAFSLYGILAVEMFLDENDNILINEVAPRPHNSGHHTIESYTTSQYEQHLRSLLDLPLAETNLKLPSVMLNILGEPGYEGVARYKGFNECLEIDGVKLHIYGKKLTRPFRKMGHATIVDSDINSALKKAKYVKEKLKVIS